jgi:hypothetical protein
MLGERGSQKVLCFCLTESVCRAKCSFDTTGIGQVVAFLRFESGQTASDAVVPTESCRRSNGTCSKCAWLCDVLSDWGVLLLLLQEYHNDLKRLGMSAAQIQSMARTGHDQSYYVDIVVSIFLLLSGAVIMYLFP